MNASKSTSKQRYHAKVLAATQKIKRLKRHHRRIDKQRADPRRGHARRLRRADIVRFRAEQRARAQKFTGTICVNAPSLGMNKVYIGQSSLRDQLERARQ